MINRFQEWAFDHLHIFLIGGFLVLVSLCFILIELLMQNDDSVRILHYARVTNISNESIMIEYSVTDSILGVGYSEKEIPVDNPSEYEIGDILAIETNRANKFLAISENSIYNIYGTVTDVGYKGITVTYTVGGYSKEEKVKKLSVDDPSQYEVGDILTIKINVTDDFVTVSKNGNVIWTNWLIL